MQAGHKHRDLNAEGDVLQHVAVQPGMDYQRRAQTRLPGGEQGFSKIHADRLYKNVNQVVKRNNVQREMYK